VIKKEFPSIFNGIEKFGKELKIYIKENARPVALTIPKTVAVPLLPKVKKELDKLVKEKVIISVDFPTEWCSPIVVIPEINSDEIRLCGDFTMLNKSIKRSIYPVTKFDVALAKLKNARIFSKLDAKAGYHQLRLDKESQKLTTIITPFGRYMFTCVPYGVNCASDYFCSEFTRVLSDIENIVIVVDDVIVFGKTAEEHDKTLRLVLEKLEKSGITLNDRCNREVPYPNKRD